MRLVTIDVTRIHLAGVRVNAVPEPGHLDSRLLASSENLSKRGIGMVIWWNDPDRFVRLMLSIDD